LENPEETETAAGSIAVSGLGEGTRRRQSPALLRKEGKKEKKM
jgi:hypothetical protein